MEPIPATPNRTTATTAGGYRLQLTLVDLIDLTLQTQHLRWNLPDDETALRSQLDDFDALVRAGSDTVAARLRELGVAPDGRIGTASLDLLFEPLPTGPLEAAAAVAAFTHRLTQFGDRLRESLDVVIGADPESAPVLEALDAEIVEWAASFGIPTEPETDSA
ncbi:MAG: hypothetical protein HKN74_01650 [Acidimicrobiia bacterium]|nr:hypothetical protein [Acidimicrobiia bacterium]MBT8218153.1 hypothetical protein [Acidimicrobiia bacterium]NNF08967.1 hypothetical protein [Acidimicrobiia bacterium]NNL70905.1 hypothetical protein [Acidimicrobiia bacterium]